MQPLAQKKMTMNMDAASGAEGDDNEHFILSVVLVQRVSELAVDRRSSKTECDIFDCLLAWLLPA